MIAVAGGKGGSGKTTTTVGLARALARRPDLGTVIAADADWDLPNLASLAEVTVSAAPRDSKGTREPRDPRNPREPRDPRNPREPRKPRTSRDRSTVVSAVAEGRIDRPELDGTSVGPRILSAPVHPADHDAASVLRRLDAAVSDGTPVLLDCPAGVSPDAAAPLRAADASVLVTSLHAPTLRDTAKTAEMARALGCPPLGTVVVRTESVPAEVADLFGCPIFGGVPDTPPAPLGTAEVRSAYEDVARELIR